MSLNYAFLLDVLIALLLVATIVYAFVLDRRLAKLRANKGELEEFIGKLTEASLRAEESTRGMRITAENCQKLMSDPVNKAQALRDELQFLIERADTVGEKLANASSRTTPDNDAGASPKPRAKKADAKGQAENLRAVDKAPAPSSAPRSKAERDLMRALKDAK